MTNLFDTGVAVSLPQVLDVKEYLAHRQQEILTNHPNESLLSFRLNIPGPIKTNDALVQVFDHFQNQFIQVLTAQQHPFVIEERQTNPAGDWLLLRVQTPPLTLKTIGTQLEEASDLSRLCDFDVLYLKDQQLTSVHRTEIGHAKRQCLICHETAKVCSRSRRHSVLEMQTKINQLVQQFLLTQK
ncbi:citrate lyase holo-[acyl-carrier protein] synthase [Agrilactobacillus yilanensis]|uniref:citrate lyase holo-[acyl-carrier protein] synthase n=1 Tax=Agrilactobacillus yilanensis TaxID=2485997 RepID=A0ABW4J921_9LACO|nr:citrate lyase holo-[acyl-carrier protein] synthase [Agrilactobacillus yilanensis]